MVDFPHKGPVMQNLMLFLLLPEQAVEQRVDLLVIWDVMTLVWFGHHCACRCLSTRCCLSISGTLRHVLKQQNFAHCQWFWEVICWSDDNIQNGWQELRRLSGCARVKLEAWTTWLTFYRQHLATFSWKKNLYFNSNFTKILPKLPINNKSSLVQVMAYRPVGSKPLPEPMMT